MLVTKKVNYLIQRVGLGSVGFEVLTEVMNRNSVYRQALLGVVNAEGPKDTVELNEDWGRQQK